MLLPLFVVIASVAAGLLWGGSLKPLEHVRLRWWALAPIGLAMQLTPFPWSSDTAQTVGALILIASFPVLLTFIGRNIRVVGLWVIFIGLALNFAVILANGSMPVSMEAIRLAGGESQLRLLTIAGDAKHHMMTPDDVLTPLADVIVIPAPVREIFSPGDLMIYGGLAWFLIATMRGRTPAMASLARRASRTRGYRGKHRVYRRPPPGAPLILQPAGGARSGTVR
jgi:hypothetical protein